MPVFLKREAARASGTRLAGGAGGSRHAWWKACRSVTKESSDLFCGGASAPPDQNIQNRQCHHKRFGDCPDIKPVSHRVSSVRLIFVYQKRPAKYIAKAKHHCRIEYFVLE